MKISVIFLAVFPSHPQSSFPYLDAQQAADYLGIKKKQLYD